MLISRFFWENTEGHPSEQHASIHDRPPTYSARQSRHQQVTDNASTDSLWQSGLNKWEASRESKAAVMGELLHEDANLSPAEAIKLAQQKEPSFIRNERGVELITPSMWLNPEMDVAALGKVMYDLSKLGFAGLMKGVGKFAVRGVEGGADGLDRIPFNRKMIIKGFQDHHIISSTNALTRDHELLDLAGFDLESRANKTFLPTDESLHPTRSIHLGRHTTVAIQEVQRRMDDVLNFGQSLGWSQSEYQSASESMLSSLRQELKAGDIALNKNMRPWANKPGF